MQSAAKYAPRQNRRAIALFAVMICLVMVFLLTAGWIRSAAVGRQQILSAERRLQAEWLAAAGLRRAVAQLAVDRNYHGETWAVAAAHLGAADAATVEIHVEPVEKQSERQKVIVTANYPTDLPNRTRVVKELLLDNPATTPKKENGNGQ